MKKLLKIIILIIVILIVLSAVFAVSVYWRYKSIEKRNATPEYIETVVVPDKKVNLGETVNVTFKIKSPWNKIPTEAEVTTGDGSQTIEAPEFFREKNKWGYSYWDIVCSLQPYRVGEIPEGKVVVNFSYGVDGISDQLILKIPSISSLQIPNVKGELSVASKIEIEKQKFEKHYLTYIILIIVAVLLTAFVIYLYFFKRKKDKQIVLTPWALALKNLGELSNNFSVGSMNPIKCISSLTDIVRNYLEDRFEIHAPRQTTEEFLRSMESWNSPLDNQDRNFLRDFMTSADMIKFAKQDAPKEEIESALERATQLVEGTTPGAVEKE